MQNIAIIPARSGSKGVINKNIKLLNGKPLIAYSIEVAKKSGVFDEIMVSTDSEEYRAIALQYGAAVPFLRCDELSNDTASSWDVVRDVLIKYAERGRKFDTVTILQPTSPLRVEQDICNGFHILQEKKADSVIGVCEMEHSPLWSNTLPEDGNMKGFIREEVRKCSGRQQLEKYYRLNGALYICRINSYEDLSFRLYDEKCFAYVMPQERSIDIDTESDFLFAECIMNG